MTSALSEEAGEHSDGTSTFYINVCLPLNSILGVSCPAGAAVCMDPSDGPPVVRRGDGEGVLTQSCPTLCLIVSFCFVSRSSRTSDGRLPVPSSTPPPVKFPSRTTAPPNAKKTHHRTTPPPSSSAAREAWSWSEDPRRICLSRLSVWTNLTLVFCLCVQGSPQVLQLECTYLFEWATSVVCPDATETHGCQLTDSQLQFTFDISSLSGEVQVRSGPADTYNHLSPVVSKPKQTLRPLPVWLGSSTRWPVPHQRVWLGVRAGL